MNPETARLKAEVAAARASVAGSVRGIRDWVANPFAVKDHIREHPWITVGAVVGTGLLIGQMLVRKKGDAGVRGGGRDWIDRLLDTAVRNAQPIVGAVMSEWLDGNDADGDPESDGAADGAPAPEPEPATADAHATSAP